MFSSDEKESPNTSQAGSGKPQPSFIKGEASFAFPRLPVSSRYRSLAGIVHVNCLINNSEAKTIRKELIEVLRHSPYPVIQQDSDILILNHERDKCLVIYDFENFAIFPIPHNLISEILNTRGEKKLNLDVSGFLTLWTDNELRLSILKPFSKEKIMLSSLPLKRLKSMLSAFWAEDAGEILIWQLIKDIASSASLLYSNNKKIPNNNFGKGQARYGRI